MKTESTNPLAFSIQSFCKAHSISRAMFYKLLNQGKAPRLFRVGIKPMISIESAAEWRARMEAESNVNEAA